MCNLPSVNMRDRRVGRLLFALRHRRSRPERQQTVTEPGTCFSDPSPTWCSSNLAKYLLHDYGAGVIPAQSVQRYASGCLLDIRAGGGTPDPIIERLGSLNPSNCARDLEKVLSSILPFDLPISRVPLTVRDPLRKKNESILHPMVFPHDLVHRLYSQLVTRNSYKVLLAVRGPFQLGGQSSGIRSGFRSTLLFLD